MKKLFVFLSLFISVISFGQPTLPLPNVAISPYLWRGQMLNTSNTYVGSRLDTVTNTTPKYFYTCQLNSSSLPVVYPLIGTGSISILATGLKVSGTLAGAVTIEESYDGVIYGPIHTSNNGIPATSTTGTVTTTYASTTPDVFTLADVATQQIYTWNFPYIAAPYWRAKVLGVGTQTSSWKVFYCFNKNFFYTN